MAATETMSRSLSDLDCTSRMFLASVCITDADLEELGVPSASAHECVSGETVARTALHRLCSCRPEVARLVSDRLDLRHLETVAFVRDLEPEELRGAAAGVARAGTGEELAAWAWALLTDPRPDVLRLGRCLMGECYVRGMRVLAG